MPFRLCSLASLHADRFTVARAAFRRNRDRKRTREIPAGERFRAGANCIRSSARNQFAAETSRAGAEIDHVIGALDGLGIVFDNEHRVAHVAQRGQGIEQAVVIARMQADRRLIEHVEHAAQLRADLRGEADALRFSAGKRRGGAIEAQIVQPDGFQELQTAADFIDDAARRSGSRDRSIARNAR